MNLHLPSSLQKEEKFSTNILSVFNNNISDDVF